MDEAVSLLQHGKTKTGGVEGTGLGLAITKSLVGLMGELKKVLS